MNECALEPNKNLTKDQIERKKRLINHIKLFFESEQQEQK